MKEVLVFAHAMCKLTLISLYLFFATALCCTLILSPIGIGMFCDIDHFILSLREVFPVGDYFEVPEEDEGEINK